MSNMAMLMLLRRMERSDLTVHGFRSTFRDWCGEKMGFDRDPVELSLAHTSAARSSKPIADGEMLEKPRPIMAAWGAYCDGADTGDAKVVRLRA